MSSSKYINQRQRLPVNTLCKACGMYRPYTDFIDTTTMTMSYMCSSCQKVHQRNFRPNKIQMVKEVPEHQLSRAFKIKHYFVGFNVVPQARWISVSDDFKIVQNANCIATTITHRTLLKETYNPLFK